LQVERYAAPSAANLALASLDTLDRCLVLGSSAPGLIGQASPAIRSRPTDMGEGFER